MELDFEVQSSKTCFITELYSRYANIVTVPLRLVMYVWTNHKMQRDFRGY